MKSEALLELAKQRQAMRLDGFACIGDFHGGIFECDHVSPYTKSGHNVDAEIMVVGQDWSSADSLGKFPPNRESAELGYTPKLPTNRNLDDLLDRHFGLTRADCYLTNLFPFVKQGGMSTGIPLKDLVASAQIFTIPEIQIVEPRLAICLGQRTFIALMRANGLKDSPRMDDAVNSPFTIGQSAIHCAAHTGALGMNNRGREQVELDWQTLAATL